MYSDTLTDMLPTSKPVPFTGIEVFLIKNEKIAKHWGFADISSMQQMMQSVQNISTTKMKREKK